MRLTCPNCGARYEVADSMIPPEGRDVQCSNCSTTWFQPGRRTDRQPEGMAAPQTPPSPDTVAPEPAMHDEGEPNTLAPEPQRREIDPAIRDILRQEAEREDRLRRTEAGLVETQAEMPLAEDPEEAQLKRRRAELDAAVDAFVTNEPSGERPVAARDLFPDIDQINSTLRDTGDRSSGDGDASDIDTLDLVPRRRRGGRIGFVLAIAFAGGAALLYSYPDLISARVPGLAPVMESYVHAVDALRLWLDGLAQRLAKANAEG